MEGYGKNRPFFKTFFNPYYYYIYTYFLLRKEIINIYIYLLKVTSYIKIGVSRGKKREKIALRTIVTKYAKKTEKKKETIEK